MSCVEGVEAAIVVEAAGETRLASSNLELVETGLHLSGWQWHLFDFGRFLTLVLFCLYI